MTGRGWYDAREKAKRTLRSIAEEAGISAPFLSDIEHGRRRPSEETEIRLRKALKLPPPEPKPESSRCMVCDGEIEPKIELIPTLHDPHGVIGPGYRPLRSSYSRHDGFTCSRCGLHYDKLPNSKEATCTP